MSDLRTPSLSTYERWDGVCPGDHQFSTLENFAYNPEDRGHSLFQRAASKLISDWKGDQFAGILLHGESGTGKSHAAIALARALHDQGADIFYRFAPELETHETSVSNWTAPRTLEPYHYAYGGSSTTTSSLERLAEGIEKTVSHTTTNHDETTVLKRDPHSVFPSYYAKGLERNPKTVLVLDDYKPLWRSHARSAIEAASNYGGLIIMTSNFGDIFQLEAPSEQDLTRRQPDYSDSDDAKMAKIAAMSAEAEKLRNAFASRLVAGFVEIPFTGIDHRKQLSFWTDLYDPTDFQ